MANLNAKALKEAREKRQWSQEKLSEEAKINVSTISRIERGISSRANGHTLKQLAAALEVAGGDLCEPPNAKPDLVKLPMDTAARNALELVARRYGVSRRTIIELAPLLFYIAAEQSLSRRRQRLEEISEAADSLNDLQSKIPHLPLEWFVPSDSFDPERASIAARDLFGRKIAGGGRQFMIGYLESYEEAEHNPFAAFLNEALEAVGPSGRPDGNLNPVCCSRLGEPSYSICYEEAADIVGGDEAAAYAIVYGRAALHEMPKGTPEQRAEWARAAPRAVVDSDATEF
jgi:transcriptional regulator with XRE-family HTH domain